MEQAIRHPDGTMITPGEWTAIKATARMIRADLLALPPPRDKRAKDRPKTKTYYRSFFSKDWDAALEKMEQHQPLLALCAAHWKADHVLGNTLLAKSSASADDESDDEPMDADKPRRSSETKKRSASRHSSASREAKKQKKVTEQVKRPNKTTSVISASDTANMSDTDTPAGRTAAAGGTDVDTAVGTKAAGTKAVGMEAVGATAVETRDAAAAETGGAAAMGKTADAPDAKAKTGSSLLIKFYY
jgi:hypothetical protein